MSQRDTIIEECGTDDDTLDSSQEDPIHIGEQEAWLILEQEATGRHLPNGSQDLRHQVLGGALVEQMARYSKMAAIQERVLDREWLALKWNSSKTAKEVLDGVIQTAFPQGKELGHATTGVLVILDTVMLEGIELDELAEYLMGLKVEVDTYNRKEHTDNYVMVALVLYTKEETDRYTDARVASANAVISAFNSFGRRPTLDLNRFLLNTEVGRPLNIRYETRFKIDEESFRSDGAIKAETLIGMTETLMEFLNQDDGLRCKEDDLTFPFKKDKDGVARYLPEYKVRNEIPRNNFGVVVEGQNPEALYWVRFRLVECGAEPDEVPPLPELDMDEYTFKPWKKGQSAETFPESQEERDRLRASKKIEKEERRRQRSQERQSRWVDQLHSSLVGDVARSVEEE